MCVFYCVSKNVTPIFHFGLISPISSYTVPSLDPIYFYDLSDWCDYVNACGIGNYNNNISNYFIWIESKNAVIFFYDGDKATSALKSILISLSEFFEFELIFIYAK